MQDDEERKHSETEAAREEPQSFCPVCNTRLTPLKCKLVCEKCGYFLSCSDFY